MMEKNLHPSIVEFKEFVRANPKIMREVKNGKYTLQELYEDWYLLGENDPRWETIGTEKIVEEAETEENPKNDMVSKIMRNISKIDPNQLQTHIYHANQAISAILSVLSQFQGSNQSSNQKQSSQQGHPFSFRKD